MGSTITEARQAERSIGNGDVAQVRSQTRPCDTCDPSVTPLCFCIPHFAPSCMDREITHHRTCGHSSSCQACQDSPGAHMLICKARCKSRSSSAHARRCCCAGGHQRDEGARHPVRRRRPLRHAQRGMPVHGGQAITCAGTASCSRSRGISKRQCCQATERYRCI